MSDQVLIKLRELLTVRNIVFKELHHAPTFTSEESALARGEDLRSGAKAILMKTDNTFNLFVLPGNERINSAAIKRYLGFKKIRFATEDELFERTGLVPGCVPPFGQPLFELSLYSDTDVGSTTGLVAFNAGSLTVSIVINTADWIEVAKPIQFSFAQVKI